MNFKTLTTISCILSVSASMLLSQVNLSNGLLAYLPLDGNGLDISGNNNHLISNSIGVYPYPNAVGLEGKALFFNNVSEGHNTDFTRQLLTNRNTFTVSFWFKPMSTGPNITIFAQGSYFTVGYNSATTRMSTVYSSSGTQNLSVNTPVGAWVHYMAVCTPTRMQVYLNGILRLDRPGTYSATTSNIIPTLGGTTASNIAVDEFRVYSRTMTPDEMAVLSSSGLISMTNDTLPSTNLCAGQQLTVPFDVQGTGIIDASNTFTLELSDANGSFNSATSLGTMSGISSGTITGAIPANMLPGTGYKLRVVGSLPLMSGTISSQTFDIGNLNLSQATLSNGRTLWLKFDNNAIDSSGLGLNGTLRGGPTYTADRFGNPSKAVQLDGIDDYITLPASERYFPTSGFSISTWIKASPYRVNQCLFEFGRTTNSNRVSATIRNLLIDQGSSSNLISYPSLSSYPTNTWMHYTITYDGTTLRSYLNGNLASQATVPGVSFLTRAINSIGRNNSGSSPYMAMTLDDFMIHGRVLEQEEILWLATDGQILANTPVCNGGALNIAAQDISGATYEWSGPNGFSSNTRTNVISNVGLANAGTYSLSLSLPNCGTKIFSKDISVLSVSASTVSFSGLPNTTSTGHPSINLIGMPSGGYFWGRGITGNQFSPSAAGIGVHEIFYFYNNPAGCSETVSKQVTVTDFYNIANTTVTACEGGFYDTGGGNGNFTGPQDITQTFCSGNGNQLRFSFSQMDLMPGDTLFIYDGASTNGLLLRLHSGWTIPDTIWSLSSCITFRLKSVSTSQRAGWRAQFECLPDAAIPNYTVRMGSGYRSVCGGVINYNGTFASVNGGVTPQTLRSLDGNRIRLDFSSFDVRPEHHVIVYDGPGTNYPVIGYFNNTNTAAGFSLESSGDFLTIVFAFNNSGVAQGRGFTASVTCTTAPLPIYTMSNTTVTTCGGAFSDPGGPLLNYPYNQDITQTFCSGSGQLLRVFFLASNTSIQQLDTLWAFDGDTPNAPLIGIFVTGSYILPIVSSGTCLTFKFKSRPTTTSMGWYGRIACINSAPASPTFPISAGVRMMCDAVIQDQGGDNRYGYSNPTQTIGTPNGNRLRLSFTSLDITPGHFLNIYDGPNTTFPLIGSYNNSNASAGLIVESLGRYLTLNLNASNTNIATGTGFNASVTCANPLGIYNMDTISVSTCGGLFFDDGGQDIGYANNLDLTKTFCSANGNSLQFNFNTSRTDFGAGDTLFVFDGNSTNAAPIGAFVRGSIVPLITSSGSCLTFRFKSDNTSNNIGWYASIACVTPTMSQPTYPMSAGILYLCDGVIQDGAGSSNYGRTNLTQTYGSNNGNRLQVRFSQFDVNTGHLLTIYDGPNSSYPVLGRYDNSNSIYNTMVIESSGRYLTFNLNTTSTMASARAGFTASVTCSTPELPTFGMANTVTYACRGIFSDSGGPLRNFVGGEDIVHTFCAGNGEFLAFNFNQNSTVLGAGDTLWVYDGPSITSPPLAIYYGNAQIVNLYSTGTCLTFRFKSDAQSSLPGWFATFSCTPTLPSTQSLSMSSGTNYVCNAQIRSIENRSQPAGPLVTNQTLVSSNGNRLMLQFTWLNLRSNGQVTVYDGPDTSFPIIGIVLSSNNFGPMPVFQSSGNSLTIISNSFVNSPNSFGFVANVSCTTPPLPSVIMGVNNNMTVCDAVFYDDGGPNGNSSGNVDQVQTLTSGNGQALRAEFSFWGLDLGVGDSLFIYDGDSISDPLLAIYIYNSLAPTVTSSGSSLTFRIKSDNGLRFRGWNAIITCVPFGPPPALLNYFSAGTRVLCEGQVYLQWTPSRYPRSVPHYEETFVSRSGERIRLRRRQWVARQSQVLTVYDGPDTNAPIIGTYTASRQPPVSIQSSGSSLTLRYTVSGSTMTLGDGFEFGLSCFTQEAIRVDSVTAGRCEGSTINVYFSSAVPVAQWNSYFAEMSDGNGNFDNGVFLGQLNTSATSGIISVALPYLTLYGSGHRVRINSSGLGITSAPNATDLAFYPRPYNFPISSSGPTIFCDSTSSTVFSVPIQSPVSYEWQRNGVSLLTSNSNSITTTLLGTYTLTISNVCGTVTPNPITISSLTRVNPFSITVTRGLCTGQSAELIAPSIVGATTTWYSSSNNSIVGTGDILNLNSSGNYYAAQGNFCGSVTSANTAIISNIAITPPSAVRVIALGQTNLCAGSSVSIQCLSPSGYSYRWFRNGISLPDTNSIITVNTAGIYSSQIVGDCGILNSIDSVQVSNSSTIPPFGIGGTQGASYLCAGDTLWLTSPQLQGVVYQWFRNNTNLRINNDSLLVTMSGTYLLRIQNTCGTYGASASQSVIVNTSAPSPPIITPSSNIICGSQDVSLNVQGQAGARYLWSRDGQLIGGNQTTLRTNTPGIYTLQLSNACGSATSSNAVTLTQVALPVVSLNLPDTLVCDNGLPIVLSGGLPPGGSYLGLGTNGGVFEPSTQRVGQNTIFYVYTDVNGCLATSTDEILVEICSGTEELEEESFSIFPNPASSYFMIKLDVSNSEDYELEIFDLLGKTTLAYNLSASELSNPTEIMLNTEKWPPGTYFVRLSSNHSTQTQILTITQN